VTRAWFLPARGVRTTEATAQQLVSTGAIGSGYDPVDNDVGFRRLGAQRREVPAFTLEKARVFSVAAYRSNPMARAIVDTYTSFCVGDSGIRAQTVDPRVRVVLERLWNDPRNRLYANDRQELLLRSHMVMGESAYEMLVAPNGAVRVSYIDPTQIDSVGLEGGNPLWQQELRIKTQIGEEPLRLPIIRHDDFTGLSDGRVLFWPDWRALASDTRGYPFLAPILDWLDNYDQVLSNLIDRTALARYLAFHVTIDGADDNAIKDFINKRGGQHAPRAGTIEVTNEKVKWEPKSADAGSYEDANTSKSVLTQIAGGAGLSKHWLAEPEDANRATSLTMAEPVRRRVRGVQGLWTSHMLELTQFAVDRAVAAGRLPRQVTITDQAGNDVKVPASHVVNVTGPEIAATDAKVNADILVALAGALASMQSQQILSEEARRVALRKAWEDYVGIPYDPALDKGENTDPDAVANRIGNEEPDAAAQSLRLLLGG